MQTLAFIHHPVQNNPPVNTGGADGKTVLYAEDDDNYSLLMRCAFKQGGCAQQLQHVKNGLDAMDYLKGEGRYSDRARYPLPCVALVDLKMPMMGGFELLDWIRRSSSHRHLPVIILTCSDELRDIRRAYELGANSFLVKPINVQDLQDTLKAVDQFWLKWNVADEVASL